jgi:hypothetical protein
VDKDNAIRAAKQVGVAPGDHIFVQTDGQITHTHFHKGQTSGEEHVDGWRVENNGGTYTATKIHSDDK